MSPRFWNESVNECERGKERVGPCELRYSVSRAKEGSRKAGTERGRVVGVTKGPATSPVAQIDPPEVTATSSPVDPETVHQTVHPPRPSGPGTGKCRRKGPPGLSPSTCCLHTMETCSQLFPHVRCHGGKNSAYLNFFQNRSWHYRRRAVP